MVSYSFINILIVRHIVTIKLNDWSEETKTSKFVNEDLKHIKSELFTRRFWKSIIQFSNSSKVKKKPLNFEYWHHMMQQTFQDEKFCQNT